MRGFDGGLGDGTGDPRAEAAAADAEDIADIEELLLSLTQLRLSVSADLSAAAGALDDERSDIAAEVVAGARSDLTSFRARTKAHAAALTKRCEPTPAAADASPASGRRGAWRGRRAGRMLVGTVALALAISVVPDLGGGSRHPSTGALPAAESSPDVRVVSSEFEVLRSALSAPNPTPSAVRTAGGPPFPPACRPCPPRWRRPVTSSACCARSGRCSTPREPCICPHSVARLPR